MAKSGSERREPVAVGCPALNMAFILSPLRLRKQGERRAEERKIQRTG